MAIGDNDLPVISFDPSSYRFDEDSGYVLFTLLLSEAVSAPVTVQFGTIDGTARGENDDYQSIDAETLTFAANTTSVQGRFYIYGDSDAEPDESLFLSLFNPVGATFGGRNHSLLAPVSILDNDTGGGDPEIVVSAPVVLEGRGVATFTVTLSEPSDGDLTLRYETVDDSAVAGDDFQSQFGTVIFENGETSATVEVDLTNDNTAEAAEKFGLAVSGGGMAAYGAASILDDDGRLPVLSVENLRVTENSGYLEFTLRLSRESTSDVTVDISTLNGSARGQNTDFQSTVLDTVTIDAGETTAHARVYVYGDDISEPDENFFIELSNAVGASFGATNRGLRATGFILDNDAGGGAPSVAVAAPIVDEARGVASFTVSLSEASDETQSFDFATVSGSARRGGDFASSSGELEFLPGQTEKTVSIAIARDSVAEANEVFGLRVTGDETGATGWATILDDDGDLPTVSLDPVRVDEVSSYANFTARLSQASTSAVTVTYTTSNGTALSSSDYQATTGTITFDPGETVASARVYVYGDTESESDETFFVTLSNPTGAAFDATDVVPTTTGFILDDDPGAEKRVISVSGTTVSEAAANGEAQAIFTIQLSRAFDEDVVIDYATRNGTARAGSDYIADSGSIRIGAGATEAYVAIDILNNLGGEANESFSLSLSDLPDDLAPSGNLTRGSATIIDGAIRGTGEDDRLSGTRYADRIEGLGGDDRLSGGRGDDALFGGAGADTLLGGAGDDSLSGGRGADRMTGGAGDDVYTVDHSRDRVTELSREGSDEIRSSISFKLPNFVETLRLTGSRDIDATGNGRANTLIGNSGDNVLNGGGGQDALTGGGGEDTFLFRSLAAAGISSSRDRITDFDRGEDVIDLHFIDANANRSGNQSFDFIGSRGYSDTAGELRYDNGIIAGDVDGDGRSDFQIALSNGISRLSDSDFVL